ncbi:MAG TPA: RNA polymerase sigma factor [Chitinivibrionales bacterium]|nr:RNA polymerase sigma factor [Chitinivibrionales bacterium]
MEELDDLTIQRAKRRNKAAFKSVYDFYAPFAWKIAFRTLHGNSELAEEAVQDTFIRAYNSLPKFEGGAAFSTWIYRITFNVCMTLLQKKGKADEMQDLDENTAAVSSAVETDMQHDLQKILKSISAEDRFLLTGREMLGFSFEELADITGKTAGALRTQLFRLKEEIRRKFGEE